MQETFKYSHLENSLPVPIVGDQVVSFAELIIFGQEVPAHGSRTKREPLLNWLKHWIHRKCTRNAICVHSFTQYVTDINTQNTFTWEYLQSCMSSPVGLQAEEKGWPENGKFSPFLYRLTRGGVKGDAGRRHNLHPHSLTYSKQHQSSTKKKLRHTQLTLIRCTMTLNCRVYAQGFNHCCAEKNASIDFNQYLK